MNRSVIGSRPKTLQNLRKQQKRLWQSDSYPLFCYYEAFSMSFINIFHYTYDQTDYGPNQRYSNQQPLKASQIIDFVENPQCLIQCIRILSKDTFPSILQCLKMDFKKKFLNEPKPKSYHSGLVQLKRQNGYEQCHQKNVFEISEMQMKCLYISKLLIQGVTGQIDCYGEKIYKGQEINRIVQDMAKRSKILNKIRFQYIVKSWDFIKETIKNGDCQNNSQIHNKKEASLAKRYTKQIFEPQSTNNKIKRIPSSQIQCQKSFVSFQSNQYDDCISKFLDFSDNYQEELSQYKNQQKYEQQRQQNNKNVQIKLKISEQKCRNVYNFEKKKTRIRKPTKKKSKPILRINRQDKFRTLHRIPNEQQKQIELNNMSVQECEAVMIYESADSNQMKDQSSSLEQYNPNPNRMVRHDLRQIDGLIQFLKTNNLAIAQSIANQIYHANKFQKVKIIWKNDQETK